MTAKWQYKQAYEAALEHNHKLKAENDRMRNLLQQDYEFMVHLNETEAYPSSKDLDMQRWLLLNEAGIEVVLNDENGTMEPVTFVPKDKAPGDTSDGYHTFDELYEHRTGLLAALCNVLATLMEEEGFGTEDMEGILFKSWHHHDGEMYDGMFIVGINCSGIIGKRAKWATWHCEAEWWDRFAIPEVDRAPEWDGHTPADALARLLYGLTPQAVKHVTSDELGVDE